MKPQNDTVRPIDPMNKVYMLAGCTVAALALYVSGEPLAICAFVFGFGGILWPFIIAPAIRPMVLRAQPPKWFSYVRRTSDFICNNAILIAAALCFFAFFIVPVFHLFDSL